MTNSYHKYHKYKSKYINLRQQSGGKNPNYYFIHDTKDINSIKSILKDGVLYAGKYIPVKKHKHGGDTQFDNVYANIYFEDLKNLSHMWSYAIILDPKIFTEYDATFNKGWGIKPLELLKMDSTKNINTNIKNIRKFIVNPVELPKIVRDAPGMLHHEVLFKDKILLENNILGVVCNYCSDKDVKAIGDIIKNKPYHNIKIFTRNYPFPTLDELKK